MTDPTPKEIQLVNDWQKENTISRNAIEEAECFLRWCRVAVEAETEQLREEATADRVEMAHLAEVAARVPQLREALEVIANNEDQVYDGEYRYHKGRAAGLREAGAVARAAIRRGKDA